MNFFFGNQDYLVINQNTFQFLSECSLIDLKELLIDQNVLELSNNENSYSCLTARLLKDARILYIDDQYVVESDITYIFSVDRRNVLKIIVPSGFSSKIPETFITSARNLSGGDSSYAFLIWKIFFDFIWTSDSTKHYNESVKNFLVFVVIISSIQQNILFISSQFQNSVPYLYFASTTNNSAYGNLVNNDNTKDNIKEAINEAVSSNNSPVSQKLPSGDQNIVASALPSVSTTTTGTDVILDKLSKLRTDTMKVAKEIDNNQVLSPSKMEENDKINEEILTVKNSGKLEDLDTNENIVFLGSKTFIVNKDDRSLFLDSSSMCSDNQSNENNNQKNPVLVDSAFVNSFKAEQKLPKSFKLCEEANTESNDFIPEGCKNKDSIADKLFPTQASFTVGLDAVQDVVRFAIKIIISNDLFEGYFYPSGKLETIMCSTSQLLDFERCKNCDTFIIQNAPKNTNETINISSQNIDFNDPSIIYSITELRKSQSGCEKGNYTEKAKRFFITLWNKITCHPIES